MRRLKQILVLKFGIALILGSATMAFGQTMQNYTCIPPFVVNSSVPPNVLIVLDNSGSMNDQAYASTYDPTQFTSGFYYGYFEPDQYYQYTNNGRWEVTSLPLTSGTTLNPIASGNFLNWATMRRIEVGKKLLIGGKASPRSPQGAVTVKLEGEKPSGWDFSKDFDNTSVPNLIYPFVGNYRYRRSSDTLTVSPIVAGSDTQYAYPIGNVSAPADWVPVGAATAWEAVDETVSDGSNTYIKNTSSRDTPVILNYDYTGPKMGTISSVSVVAVAKKSSGTTMRLQGVVQIGGVNYASSFSNLTTSYSPYTWAWNTNPATGAAWQWNEIKSSGIGSLQGFGVQAAWQPTPTNYPSVTQIYLVIRYSSPSGGPYSIIVDQGMKKAEGIIDTLSSDVRFGLDFYNTGCGLECGTAGRYDGGNVANYVDFGSTTNMITSISNLTATTYTPLAETLYEAVRYFRQDPPYYPNNPADYQTGAGTQYDPYYYMYSKLSGSTLTDQYAPCAKSFVLLLTDGESTMDKNIPASLKGLSAGYRFAGTPVGTTYGSNGTDYLIDVAYWARTTDARPGTCTDADLSTWGQCLPGDQNIILYSVFMFGKGSQLLKDAAIDGGFEDLNKDGKPGPDLKEYLRDSNKDGNLDSSDLPLTYFEGDDGYELQENIIAAIADILKRSASGTSVSILSTTEKGEGALYQAYFFPTKLEGLNQIRWLGYLQGLFLDSMGNLREDTNQNQALDLTTDKIVKLVFDTTSGQTLVQRFDDANGDGTPDSATPSEIVTLDQIQPIWEAGKLLALRADTDRKIYTWVDSNNDGTVAPSEFISFDSSQKTLLRPYLRASDTTESQNIIDFIRGADITGYRNRSITVDGSLHVWKLGDIIYSTPVTVGKPKEQYDLVYKDSSYQQFMQQYLNRRDVVYVGANDGMLHAFNAGTYDPTTRKFDPGTGHTLGEELWAFVPYNLLPHLKWLTQTDYTHVYYVDLKPKVVDAKIFSADADHPGGWGTVLIGGMRFGGGFVSVTDNFGSGTQTRTFQSSYFALDITNPEKPPVLLWSATDPKMGFTTSYPAVARAADSTGGSKWVVIMGSGPTLYTGERTTSSPNLFSGADNYSHLYVFDLTNGALLKRFDNTTSNEFLGDVTTLDGNLDYGVDTVYVGSAYKSTTWMGNMYRVVTNNDTNPANWNVSTLLSGAGPILEAPSLSIDSFLNIWVFFGTGRFLSVNDKITLAGDVQSMYGIKESKMCWLGGTSSCPTPALTPTSTELLNVSDAKVFTDQKVLGVTGLPSDDFAALINAARNASGWILNFQTAGERVLAKPVIIGGVVLFSTFTPSNELCSFQGEGTLYAVYFETGSAYNKSVIGIDSSTNEVLRRTDLGQGIPSMAGLHVGTEEGVRGFVQQGTGSISEIDGEPPFKFKSGVVTWQEKQM